VFRTILCVAALATAALPSVQADQTENSKETLIRLRVQPMPAPSPALRYLLLPELKEMNPGNPIHNYLRCFAEQQKFFFDKETCNRRDQLLVMPLSALPAQELQDYGKSALRQADWAARLDRPDWQILLRAKADGIGLLLPDVQQMRALANALKVRFRAQVALHRFDDAIGTAKTMFALAHHMGEHPTLIAGLVGFAITAVAIGPLEEMLEQPGCPNLYWALTNLPNPLICIELGLESERMWIVSEFKDLDDTGPMSEAQLKKVITRFDDLLRMEGSNKQTLRQWLDARAKDQALVDAARRRLTDYGLMEEQVKQFPPHQVLLLDEKRDYEVRRDDMMKYMNLPMWQTAELALQPKPDQHWGVFAKALVPALYNVRSAQGRIEQRIALLRHVEALRLYAAGHDSKLPEKLADCGVPLPVDPFTGQAFRYKKDGATAHVWGTPPRGREKLPAFNVHYEVTIQK
jgi:hypothetical protein